MLSLGTAPLRTCSGLTRRQILQVGGLGLLGLSLGDLLRQRQASATASPRGGGSSEVSCIFLWLDGGPSHFETFDPKPNTPEEIRGPYGTIKTNVPTIHICELLPRLAGLMDRCALIRSMSHNTDSHSPVPMMTAFNDSTTAHGAVVTRMLGHRGDMPPYVHLGSRLNVGGGVLGPTCNPIVVPDPSGKQVRLPNLSLSADISADRLQQRRQLLQAFDRLRAKTQSDETLGRMDAFYQRAIDMLTSPRVRQAFDLSREKESLRDRYGVGFFGQSCLLARRLVEAGTRFVQVKWYDGPAFDAWDVHGADLAGMARMEQQLCPRLDQGLSALLEDLSQRGLLRSTLVVVAGEFGRTPRINKYGARDHWPRCFSVLLAGGGVPGGIVYGASDREGAYPASNPVSPPELAATLYKLLGINVNLDPRIRPFIKNALPISDLA